MIIHEIIKQRYQGIKNESGVYITPSFPKLVYVLDKNNAPKDSKYRYITDACVLCSSKRLYPDYISAKLMRQTYEGNVFWTYGCFRRSYHHGKMKMVIINLKDALTWVLYH